MNALTLTALATLLWAAPADAAARRLLLFGGGDRSREAMTRLAELAGGEKGRILVVTWASEIPEERFKAFAEDMAALSKVSVEHAPTAAELPKRKAEFLDSLGRAGAVYFGGGDQNRIAFALKEHPDVKEALKARYRAGALFSGTSAGTAVMSKVMITGEGDFTVVDGSKVGVDEGLGLLEDAILDQHFLAKQRSNRLFGLVLARPALLGVGIDEPSALLVEDERLAEPVGPGQVVMARAEAGARLVLDFLVAGRRYDLKKRRPL